MSECKHCGKEIKYNQDLQRWDHVHNHYDSCYPRLTPGFDPRGRDNGFRAEPKK